MTCGKYSFEDRWPNEVLKLGRISLDEYGDMDNMQLSFPLDDVVAWTHGMMMSC